VHWKEALDDDRVVLTTLGPGPVQRLRCFGVLFGVEIAFSFLLVLLRQSMVVSFCTCRHKWSSKILLSRFSEKKRFPPSHE
jgi:hypothetical protein